MKVAVLGAGPAGLMATYTMVKENIDVDLYEAGPTIGGLAKTSNILSHKVETGAHFLRKSFFESCLQQMHLQIPYTSQERKTFIYYKHKLFSYPPGVKDLLHNFNLLELGSYAVSLLKNRVKTSGNESARSVLSKQLGQRFYLDFFEPYFRKIWGLSGNHLDAIFATGLLGNKSLSVWESLKKIARFNKDTKDSYGEVVYPNGGFSTLWDAIGKEIMKNNGTIFTSSHIKNIYSIDRSFIIDANENRYYDYMISTIAPTTLIRLMNQKVTFNLNYRHIMIVYLSVDVSSSLDFHCLYVYDERCRIARLTNYSFFEGNSNNNILIGLEYWLGDKGMWEYNQDEIWMEINNDLAYLPFFRDAKIKEWEVKKFANAYVIPDLSMQKVAETIREGLQQYPQLFITGRNQSKNFNYSMEDAMNDGMSTAKQIISKRKSITPIPQMTQ